MRFELPGHGVDRSAALDDDTGSSVLTVSRAAPAKPGSWSRLTTAVASIEANDPAASGAPGQVGQSRQLSARCRRQSRVAGRTPQIRTLRWGVLRTTGSRRSQLRLRAPKSAASSGPLFRLALHQQGAEVVASSPGGSWTKVIARPTVTQMGNRRLDARAFGLLVTLLVLIGAAFLWMRRRRWTDHDVSDPGVTL